MRFDLRLHGRTSEGRPCYADVSVYASSKKDLQREAQKAAETGPWRGLASDADWIPEESHITVERVELLNRRGKSV